MNSVRMNFVMTKIFRELFGIEINANENKANYGK